MLVWLAHYLEVYFRAFHVVQYITFRAIMSVLTAFAVALFIGPLLINKLKQYKVGQTVRDDGPQSHLSKSGTPTMGGLLILVAITVSTLLWADLDNRYVWILLIGTLAFGFIGAIDDYRKLVKKNTRGLSARLKLLWQSIFALTIVLLLYFTAHTAAETQLFVPFFKSIAIDLRWLFVILGYFVIVGTSNAVNLTDGLDGLATLPIVLVGGALGVFAYLSGNAQFAHYLAIPALPGVGDVAIISAAIVGAGLGFLWFNAYPAMVFMGDVGSLGLGAALGIMAVMVRQELVLFLMGGVFVAETLSVIIQVASFKLTGKRVFKMAPLHHHFELLGWPEPRVIVRFWIITLTLVLVGLATLKLR